MPRLSVDDEWDRLRGRAVTKAKGESGLRTPLALRVSCSRESPANGLTA